MELFRVSLLETLIGREKPNISCFSVLTARSILSIWKARLRSSLTNPRLHYVILPGLQIDFTKNPVLRQFQADTPKSI